MRITKNQKEKILNGDVITQNLFVQRCKEKLSLHHPSNPYFAKIENAVINEDFEKFIGNWYYTKKKIGWFSNVILKNWGLLGYSECHTELAPLLIDSDCNRKEQLNFFLNQDSTQMDWNSCSEVHLYLDELRSKGFFVQFFCWDQDIRFSLLS